MDAHLEHHGDLLASQRDDLTPRGRAIVEHAHLARARHGVRTLAVAVAVALAVAVAVAVAVALPLARTVRSERGRSRFLASRRCSSASAATWLGLGVG